VCFELAAQRADMNLDDVGVVGVVAPDLREQLMLRENQAALADEIGEEAQLGRGQLERRAGARRQAGLLVHHDVAGFDRRAEAACPPQHGTHPGEQLLEGERLDQVVVGAEFEAAQPVLHGVTGGQEDDRQVTRGAQLSRQLETVAAGEEHVEHREIRGGGEHRLGAGVVGEPGDGDPLAPERALDRQANRLLVLDQHHPWRVRAHGGSICPIPSVGRRPLRLQVQLSNGWNSPGAMSAPASPGEAAIPGGPDRTALRAGRGVRLAWVEATLAVAAFTALSILVLSVAPQPAEPDDGAYRASIVAMTKGHFLTLSIAQAETLARELGDNPGAPPNQWVEVAHGRYISEKNPGYPFLAAPFQALGIIRWAPLFYGALACLGLFFGARRWLGRFGGLASVGLYCSSGAALAFAWRDYMPTFTDASLIAAGSGALLWSVLATEAGSRRRTWVGLAGFAGIELATFVRYTDVVILGCVVAAVFAAWRLRVARLPLRRLAWWLASVAVFGVGVAVFDDLVYGGPLTTGYQSGEVTFAFGAIGTNLRLMPAHLLQAMPMVVLGLMALVWIIVRWVMLRGAGGEVGAATRADLWVALALAASWFASWGLYSAYTWTTDPTSVSVQVVRFYLPALGAIALLGAWLVTRIRGRSWLVGLISSAGIAALFAVGVWAFHAMYAAFGVPLSG
jgi:hypothetical protein